MDFGEYEQFQTLRDLRAKQIDQEADRILDENLEAFQELAK